MSSNEFSFDCMSYEDERDQDLCFKLQYECENVYSPWLMGLLIAASVLMALTGLMLSFHPRLKKEPSYPLIGYTCLAEAMYLCTLFSRW